ncbi:MAG: hypothetical protein J7L47_09185 [Candidatus Odinarchaeota archaeon]|nr:hypothetical protein [Candidatus Odinarchaeota archaeon]
MAKRHSMWIGKNELKLLEDFVKQELNIYTKGILTELVKLALYFSLWDKRKEFLEFVKNGEENVKRIKKEAKLDAED